MRQLVLVLLLLSGCAAAAPSSHLDVYAHSHEVLRWCEEYRGHPPDGMRTALGPPLRTLALSNGNTALCFDRIGWNDYLVVEVGAAGLVEQCGRIAYRVVDRAAVAAQRQPGTAPRLSQADLFPGDGGWRPLFGGR